MAGVLILPLASCHKILRGATLHPEQGVGMPGRIPKFLAGCLVDSRKKMRGARSHPENLGRSPSRILSFLAGCKVTSRKCWRVCADEDNGPANMQLWYGMDRSEQACLSYGSEGVKHVWRTGRDWRSFWHTGGRFGIREGSFWHTGRAGLAYGRATAPRTASARESQP